MPKTIVLTELIIRQVNIDYTRNVVVVTYDRVDSEGHIWDSGEATFWATLPAEPNSHWFQLPPAYITLLLAMRNDADAALTNAFLT